MPELDEELQRVVKVEQGSPSTPFRTTPPLHQQTVGKEPIYEIK